MTKQEYSTDDLWYIAKLDHKVNWLGETLEYSESKELQEALSAINDDKELSSEYNGILECVADS